MAAKKATPQQSKSAFIRSQPATMSAAEVVERGKAAGVPLRAQLVYEVRRVARAKKGKAKRFQSSGKGLAKKVRSKADFVRTHANASAKEISEKAAAAGIKLGTRYVYNVRRSDRAAATKRKRESRSGAPRKGVAVPRPIVTTSRAEDLLKALGAEVGLAKAIEILRGERARVQAVLGG